MCIYNVRFLNCWYFVAIVHCFKRLVVVNPMLWDPVQYALCDFFGIMWSIISIAYDSLRAAFASFVSLLAAAAEFSRCGIVEFCPMMWSGLTPFMCVTHVLWSYFSAPIYCTACTLYRQTRSFRIILVFWKILIIIVKLQRVNWICTMAVFLCIALHVSHRVLSCS